MKALLCILLCPRCNRCTEDKTGEEVQFFCTDVTLFAHSRQVKTFSSELLSLGTIQQEYTVLGGLSFLPGTEQVEGNKCGLFMINVQWLQPKCTASGSGEESFAEPSASLVRVIGARTEGHR